MEDIGELKDQIRHIYIQLLEYSDSTVSYSRFYAIQDAEVNLFQAKAILESIDSSDSDD